VESAPLAMLREINMSPAHPTFIRELHVQEGVATKTALTEGAPRINSTSYP